MTAINITSAQYVAHSADSSINDHIDIVVDGKTLSVPINTDNTDYQAILEWVADGNTIQDAD